MEPKEKQKVIVYVDGFNFYYGLRQSLLPDTVHLSISDFDLQIPERWKNYQK